MPERHRAALDRVLELTILLGDDMTREFARRGLTQARTQLLWAIGEGGPTTQRALAEALGVSARNVTGLVDGLEQTGFVTREPHPTDRRATLVTPTAHGAETVAQLRRDYAELAELLFGRLPTPRFDEFARALDEIVTALRDALARG
ncbi:MarR family winged helix-turn-helix transcriptional regulator [Conexibacter woesei]|uniref:Transcriptional regulator, MarR family n=1 Tax=Conexibacter woesei (strain DSM 14684 / CCUG 47730 / CIP 108061 / JCM 11494 / NBRC 100937 / ID131577) TaxID=469383 RepID=D3FDG4_CONWI|nr:MarR family transcriptional regulator [Conexibacter woesei]ADB53556.1 transcriptional regulator, MarR family [Conexibacter woesei DSM 14684]